LLLKVILDMIFYIITIVKLIKTMTKSSTFAYPCKRESVVGVNRRWEHLEWTLELALRKQ